MNGPVRPVRCKRRFGPDMLFQWVSLLVLIAGVAAVQLSDVKEQKSAG